ncbi:hypothetical protein [Microbacterium paraoxydans]|uniref:hypothetical protein n=1 Tax=Microbacterium paraoxydans TaxID=199592 RepID=UPI0004690F9E|nr:hypothetical protein [Microbacterium paraoxydans]
MSTSVQQPVPFLRHWDLDSTPHLLVTGRIGAGRTAVVDQLIGHLAKRNASIAILYPSLNPQLAAATSLARGTVEAEVVLQRQLAEMHRRYSAVERRQLASVEPVLTVVDSLAEILDGTADQALRQRVQLDVEALAILGGQVGMHLVLSSIDAPYLAHRARKDLGTIAIVGSDRSQGSLGGRFCPPGSVRSASVYFEADSVESS